MTSSIETATMTAPEAAPVSAAAAAAASASASASTAATTSLREIAELPGPKGWPIVGNLFQIENKAHIHRQVERWTGEFGPYFRFQLGARKIFVVADHAAVGAIFRDRPDGFRRTQRL